MLVNLCMWLVINKIGYYVPTTTAHISSNRLILRLELLNLLAQPTKHELRPVECPIGLDVYNGSKELDKIVGLGGWA